MAETSPPLLLVGPYPAAQREAQARGLTWQQWRHIGGMPQVQGTAHGSRYVIVGGLDAHHAGRLAEITEYLAARDAIEEAPVGD